MSDLPIKHTDWPIRQKGEYLLLFHSPRCIYHQAHPVSILQSSDQLWGALLRCTDDDCVVTVGRVSPRQTALRVTRKEIHEEYKRETGHSPSYIPRDERRGITDPKTPAQLATWIAQNQKRKRKRKRT